MNTLRIINATNHQLPGDRESLFWVNVKAIPAMEKDQKNENTLQLAIISRIKMFYRPTNLAMAPEEAPAMLRFRRSGSKLTLINPTPYFITVTNMKAGNSNLPNTMVPPKGEVSVDITHAATGDISFQTINDYGALTPRKFIPTGVAMPYYHLRQNIEKTVLLLTRIPLQIMLNWMKPWSLSSQLTVLLPEQHLMHKSAGKY